MKQPNRRQFIDHSTRMAGGAILFSSPLFAGATDRKSQKEYTVQEIIDLILREVPGAPFPQTVDTIKCGKPEQLVTGIVTTMFPTIAVLKKAIAQKMNFIIAHEPSFYNHTDDRDWVKPNDVVKQKLQMAEEHGLVIWRFHDYCHALQPDAITYGVVKKLNWLPYYKTGEKIISIPQTTLAQLTTKLKEALGIRQLRVIGDPGQSCGRIALLPGAWGGQRQIGIAEEEHPDTLIVGEVHEWETAEYIRDAQALGKKIALVVLGHSQSEEPGMDWVADWLQPRLPGVRMLHIPSGSPFRWV